VEKNVEVVTNRVSLWEAYKQGIGVALGILTVYILAIALLALLAARALTSSGPTPQPTPEGGSQCSSSWV